MSKSIKNSGLSHDLSKGLILSLLVNFSNKVATHSKYFWYFEILEIS